MLARRYDEVSSGQEYTDNGRFSHRKEVGKPSRPGRSGHNNPLICAFWRREIRLHIADGRLSALPCTLGDVRLTYRSISRRAVAE